MNMEANHMTLVNGLGISGNHEINENLSVNHASIQFTKDELDYSKMLVDGDTRPGLNQGKFTDREYYKLSVVPEYQYTLSQNEYISYKAGVSLDDSNSDKERYSPITEIRWTKRKILNEKKASIYLTLNLLRF